MLEKKPDINERENKYFFHNMRKKNRECQFKKKTRDQRSDEGKKTQVLFEVWKDALETSGRVENSDNKLQVTLKFWLIGRCGNFRKPGSKMGTYVS